jgi:uncharacterized protein (DUF2249 family)
MLLIMNHAYDTQLFSALKAGEVVKLTHDHDLRPLYYPFMTEQEN